MSKAQQIKAKKRKDETAEQLIARYALTPEMSAALTQIHVMKGELFGSDLDINALVDELTSQTEAIKGKDLSRAEEMLVSQAHTLDMLFQQLAIRGAQNAGEYLGATETYFKLALKAQSQCRCTLEAISKIQNPPLAGFVQQLNAAHNQQVNNEKPQNQLSGENHELLPDKSHEGSAITIDTPGETMGEVHWSEDATG